MRKLSIAAILLLSHIAVSGAITGNTQWDVRTTGANINGGGFDSTIAGAGTDYSQQNSPQFAYTDMVLGSGGTSYTSVAHSPTSLIVGNIVQVISGSGCTAGFYQVTGVTTGVATLDRSAGSAASTCTSNLGGSLLTIVQAEAPSVALNTIWLQSGTYAITTGLTVPVANLTYEGYAATHGDMGTKPIITTSASINIFTDVAAGVSNVKVVNITMQSTAGSPGNGFEATSRTWTGLTLVNCKLSGLASGIFGDNAAPNTIGPIQIINTEIAGMSFNGIEAGSGVYVYGSYIHSNTRNGILSGSAPAVGSTILVDHSIIASNSESGVEFDFPGGGASFYSYNSVYYNNTTDGIHTVNTLFTANLGIANNIFYSNGVYGFSADTTTGAGPGINQNNAYGANGTAPRNNIAVGLNDVALSANPFTSAGTGNFTLNSTAGGGTALKQAGFPGTIGGALGTGLMDIGTMQSGSGGGGATLHAYPIVQ